MIIFMKVSSINPSFFNIFRTCARNNSFNGRISTKTRIVILAEVETITFGAPVYLVSANDDDVTIQLQKLMPSGQTVALIDSSGAGKSTLINRLYGDEIQATGSISQSIGKGKHTTTSRELIILPSGGVLIDNPGIREIAFAVEYSNAESAFPDIDEFAQSCKFPDYSHTHEPGCQVLQAVSSGKLTPSSLKSFQKIENERIYFSHREEKGAARVEKERWKEVSKKMKAVRKRLKNG